MGLAKRQLELSSCVVIRGPLALRTLATQKILFLQIRYTKAPISSSTKIHTEYAQPSHSSLPKPNLSVSG
jgi:hypothetical protein